MSQQILQVNFRFNLSRSEYEKALAPLLDKFAKLPGCHWKVWLMNESKNEAGGIYLFVDEEAVANFKMSELYHIIANHPALSNFSVKQFDILKEFSDATHAPLEKKMVEYYWSN